MTHLLGPQTIDTYIMNRHKTLLGCRNSTVVEGQNKTGVET